VVPLVPGCAAAEQRPWMFRPYDTIDTAPGTSELAIATALRALESIMARPHKFQVTPRPLAHIVQALDQLWASASQPPTDVSCFTNTSYLLIAIARHQQNHLGRLMPLYARVVRGLLASLIREEGNAGAQSQICRAELLAQVMVEISGLKPASKYCAHILGDYLILAAGPPTALAEKMTGSVQRGGRKMAPDGTAGGGGDRSGGHMCSEKVGLALRQGAYALYGACGAAEVQYLYASLGGKREGSGVWRMALADLKADHDKHFKYTGKV